MLNCKQVAQRASDYLDGYASTNLTWQMRIHLMMCANCRRFVRHLRISKTIAGHINTEPVNAEDVLAKIKAKQQASGDDKH